MKNRSRFVICVVAVLFVLLTGAVSVSSVPALAEETTTRYKIAHVTDMHVFIENYANIYSRAYIDKAKGTKLLEESQLAFEIAFNELMNMKEPPMYVFITGDITNDGEIENHEWVGNKTLSRTVIKIVAFNLIIYRLKILSFITCYSFDLKL